MARKVHCEGIIEASPDATHEGCPVVSKRRHISTAKGQCSVVTWGMRWPDGQVADFSDCLVSSSVSDSLDSSVSWSESVVVGEFDVEIVARFQGCDRGPVLAETIGEIIDPENGIVRFQLPPEVCQNSGIYQFQLAVRRGGQILFTDGGLISVEHGLFGDTDNMRGPPTLEEIRFHLRDRAAENDLLQAVEFDDAEILEAIRRPVMEFNETPPPICHFNCNNFPYRYHWLNAIVAELLRVAAHHYVRNKMETVGSGLRVDDKNKNDDYLRMAGLYIEEWKIFIARKKAELNANLAYGTVGSDYR